MNSRGSSGSPGPAPEVPNSDVLTVPVCWKFYDFGSVISTAVQPGTHVHRIAGERQALSGRISRR